MRNLNLLRNIYIEDAFLADVAKCLVVTESSASKSTKIYVLNRFIELYQLSINENHTFESTFILDLFQFVDEPELKPTIVGCSYVYDELHVVLSTGYLISTRVSAESDDDDRQSFGQSLGVGCAKLASWSPDFERTVVVNAEDTLFVLTVAGADFERLNEIRLQDDVTEERNKFVNVGWGRAETQFRGSEGKFSATAVTVDAMPRPTVDDESVNVCWKPNGAAFAVSYVCQTEHLRRIKIFSQDGVLLNATKNVGGLLAPVDWCAGRNLLFCPQALPNKLVVARLEENALKHGEFEIAKDARVEQLSWNASGTILACRGTRDGREFVTLWTTSNYKWYVKQHLRFDDRVVHLQWDDVSPNRLHVITKSGVYRSYEWNFVVNESSGSGGGHRNKALVSVVDGVTLGVTPYALVSRPPSMPYAKYDLAPDHVNAVVFPGEGGGGGGDAGDFDRNSTLLYLDDGRVRLLKYGERAGLALQFAVANTPLRFSTPSELSAFTWLLPDRLYFAWCKSSGHYFCAARLDATGGAVLVQKAFKMNSPVMATCSHGDDVLVHVDAGNVYLYRDGSLRALRHSYVEPCVRLRMLNERTLLALSENRNLYANERICWRDVVSFGWRAPFVVVVTTDNRLLVREAKFADDGETTLFDEVLARDVEPKSYLVTVVDDRVLLETERGNLETIVPRPFSLADMERKLRDGRYSEALKTLRKRRINPNVLFDHDAGAFVRHVDDLVADIADPLYLLTFVIELENRNVAAAMFPWRYGRVEATTPDKVNVVCDALCAAIRRRLTDRPKLTAVLVAALVKRGALAEAAAYAVEHDQMTTLTQLCDPVAAYRAALRAFDLTNALRVVQHSKLDPSEYLPFVRELQATEENYRKFRVCDFLEQRAAALSHLADCEEAPRFDECVAYVRRHRLFRTALEVFAARRSESETRRARYATVLAVVAEHHHDDGRFADAAILFEKANLEERALRCYVRVGDWRSAMAVWRRANAAGDPSSSVVADVYAALVRDRRHEEAGFVAQHFAGDSRLAVDAYLTAGKYGDAINAAVALRDERLLDELIKPALVSRAAAFRDECDASLAPLVEYARRLRELVERKARLPEPERGDDARSVVSSTDDGSDASSVTTSGVSRASGSSSASGRAKRARRRERKLWNLKPGNRREEQSLVKVVRETIASLVAECREAVPDLTKALLRMDEFVMARELKTNSEKVLESIYEIVCQVWSGENLPQDGAGFQDILIQVPPEITWLRQELTILDCK